MSQMKEQFEAMGMAGMDFSEKQSLLINRKSTVIKKLFEMSKDDANKEKVELICSQVADLAILSNRELSPEQLNEYIERSNKILMLVLK